MGSFDNNYNLKAVRANYDDNKTYKIGELYRPARAAAMVYLEPSKKCGYNLKLKYAQDTDFFMRYLDGQKYLNSNKIHYYYSEYESVTKKKTLTTNYYSILSHKQLISSAPIPVIKRISINIFKMCVKMLTYPFVSDEFYLDRRGNKPDDLMISDFKSALKLNSKDMKNSSKNINN
jgi:hypothetical protein